MVLALGLLSFAALSSNLCYGSIIPHAASVPLHDQQFNHLQHAIEHKDDMRNLIPHEDPTLGVSSPSGQQSEVEIKETEVDVPVVTWTSLEIRLKERIDRVSLEIAY